jgi:hypothetical protein
MIGDPDRTVKSGETVEIEAQVSDPDPMNIDEMWAQISAPYEQAGVDKERFAEYMKSQPKTSQLWWQYEEAGSYDGMVKISDPGANRIHFTAPDVDKPETIHIILEATDRGTPALTSFARIIVTVLPD